MGRGDGGAGGAPSVAAGRGAPPRPPRVAYSDTRDRLDGGVRAPARRAGRRRRPRLRPCPRPRLIRIERVHLHSRDVTKHSELGYRRARGDPRVWRHAAAAVGPAAAGPGAGAGAGSRRGTGSSGHNAVADRVRGRRAWCAERCAERRVARREPCRHSRHSHQRETCQARRERARERQRRGWSGRRDCRLRLGEVHARHPRQAGREGSVRGGRERAPAGAAPPAGAPRGAPRARAPPLDYELLSIFYRCVTWFIQAAAGGTA